MSCGDYLLGDRAPRSSLSGNTTPAPTSGAGSRASSVAPMPPTPAQAAAQAAVQAERCAGAADASARAAQEVKDLMDSEKLTEIRLRKAWFPYLATALVLNVALWLSILYQVYDIENYYTNRSFYESIGWLVIMGIPVGILLFAVWCQKPKLVERGIEKFTSVKRSPNYGAMLTSFFCFVFVIVYFRTNAVNKYGTSDWAFQVEYNESLALPAFALVGGYQDAAMATFAGGGTKCTFPIWVNNSSNDCPLDAFKSKQTIRTTSGVYGNLTAYVFDPAKLQAGKNLSTALSDRVLLKVNVNYNSDDLKRDYTEQAMQTPYLFAALFDPRVDLGSALDCGLVALTEIPALASNTFTITANYISDTLQMVHSSGDQTACKEFYAKTLALKEPPYTSYAFHLGSMTTLAPNTCDTAIAATASCVSQVILRFGTHIVSKMESRHGMDKIDILLFEGAVVGAIQFFAWFIGIFTL